jgi:hypothetical protein
MLPISPRTRLPTNGHEPVAPEHSTPRTVDHSVAERAAPRPAASPRRPSSGAAPGTPPTPPCFGGTRQCTKRSRACALLRRRHRPHTSERLQHPHLRREPAPQQRRPPVPSACGQLPRAVPRSRQRAAATPVPLPSPRMATAPTASPCSPHRR